MVPFILPCALLIAQEATKEHFVAHILPYLKPVMKIQDPVQVIRSLRHCPLDNLIILWENINCMKELIAMNV